MQNTDIPPGKIISVREAKIMKAAYVQRLADTKAAFDRIGGGPFEPEKEALGWVFHRSHIETVLNRLGAGDEYIVILFGVGPREAELAAQQETGPDELVRCIITPARNTTTPNVYQLSKLAPGFADADEFGAEQGNTCCHRLNAFECHDQLLNTGIFEMFL